MWAVLDAQSTHSLGRPYHSLLAYFHCLDPCASDGEVLWGFAVVYHIFELERNRVKIMLSQKRKKRKKTEVLNDRLGMNVLNTGNELIDKQKNSFQRELPVAEVEEILQARSKEIKNHDIVPKVGSIPMDRGDADASG